MTNPSRLLILQAAPGVAYSNIKSAFAHYVFSYRPRGVHASGTPFAPAQNSCQEFDQRANLFQLQIFERMPYPVG
jgi:hypothetical protein